MTNFEKVTASPEALGKFLAALSVATGPWDKDFCKVFCEGCGKSDCGACPHEKERNNPLWWLTMGGEPGEVPGLSINIKAAFPIMWGKEYYSVAAKKKERRAPCTCCDNTGKVTIKGVEYDCPRCKGDWREREVVGETTIYSVAKWELKSISATPRGITLNLEQTNSTERYGGNLQIPSRDFHDMVYREYGKVIKFYDDYKAAMAEVKRLNAAEREKQKENDA